VLVAAVLTNQTDRQATIHLSGGDLQIEWDAATHHVFMTGPAEEAFHGEIAV
jgi:diaminopimelate epimerase